MASSVKAVRADIGRLRTMAKNKSGGGNSHQRNVEAAKKKAASVEEKKLVPAIPPATPPEKFLEKAWKFIYDALFLTAIGVTFAIVSLLLVSSDPLVIRASKVLLVIAWLFYSAAIRKANFFQKQTSDRRALGDAAISLAVGILLATGFYYIPWHQEPRLYTKGFSRFMSAGAKPIATLDVLNDSDYPSNSMNMEGQIKLVPNTGRDISSKDASDSAALFALDDATAKEIFEKLDRSSVLHDMPFKGTLNPHVLDHYTLYGDDVLTADQVKQHEEGNLIVFIGGRIKYKDSDGCVYKSDFCGFWGKSIWYMANCHSGHFEQAVRLK